MKMAIASTRKRYSYDADLQPIVEGKLALPNTEPVDPLLLLNSIASGGHSMTPRWGWALRDGRKQWTQFFLTPATMGGANSFDGGGYAIIWGGSAPITLRFAVCKHENAEGAGANHSRGWHPGHCGKCGFDMSVGSGD
jgi:hypothetical protein